MDGERWRRLEAIFHAALAEAPDERGAYLDRACAGDATMRREVESLLAAHDDPDGMLREHPTSPVPRAPALLAGDAGGPAPEERGLEPGTIIEGRYRVEALLARGGMGAVYRATHLALDRPVALKVVRGALVADARMTESFMREARTISRLKHPNIVTVHDFGTAPGVGMYLVMELVEGRSLGAELKDRGWLPVELAVDLAWQICAAVQAAHEAGVIHRDIKPDNVVLEWGSNGPVAKVLDFGIAKLQQGSGAPATIGVVVVGTPAYMAPEQCSGEAADARTDVYALGCVLYQMLVGRPPFRADSVAQLMLKHLTEEPRPPREERAEIPAGVEAAVLRALAKAPDHRFPTAARFASALGSTAATLVAETADRPVVAPDNLPQPLTSFVGRRTEIAGVEAKLASGRLVTLVGPGGVGKTRLALEVAGGARDRYRGGVWLVELAGLADPAVVPSAVAGVLGVREEVGRPLLAALRDSLASRQLLLVLDNCEHLADACAALVDAMLRASPGLEVLATSREPLGVEGEAVEPVPPLSLPPHDEPHDAGELERFEAARLFVERATSSRPDFAVTADNAGAVAELCRRLEGIPLAIELAASRARGLTVEQMLAKMDDRFRLLAGGGRARPKRQQTLRDAIDWSHDMLSDDERTLFRRLSVFSGGFTLKTAESVCRVEPSDPSSTEHSAPGTRHFDVLDVLTRLVDRSLVIADLRQADARYRMLESIREYAAEKLGDSGEEAVVLARFDAWLVELARRGQRELVGPDQARWFERIEAEHDNLRSLLRRGREGRADVARCLEVCVGLRFFWYVRGHVGEGRAWYDEFLARSDSVPIELRADALYGAAGLAIAQCDYERTEAFIEEGVDLYRKAGDTRSVIGTLLRFGYLLAEEREYDRSRAVCTEVLALCEETGDEKTGGVAHYYLGLVALGTGDFAEAVSEFDTALAIIRKSPNARGVGAILHSLGEALVYTGDRDRAEALLSESLTMAEEVGDRRLVADTTTLLGVVDCERGDFAASAARHREALAIQAELADRIGVAYAIEGLSRAAAGLGSYEVAGRLEGSAASLRRRARWKPSVPERERAERFVAGLRAAVGDTAADRAIARGEALEPEAAVAFALERADELARAARDGE